MFDQATRQKLRFNSPVGDLSVEDLWDLPLRTSSETRASLNNVAVAINRRIKASEQDEDFISQKPVRDASLQLKMDIVRHIIKTKLEDAEQAAQRQANRERNARIREIIDTKGDRALERKSIKELEKMLTEDN